MSLLRVANDKRVRLAVFAIIFCLSVPAAQAQRLGRLFTTPEQRSSLNEARLQAQIDEPELPPEPEPMNEISPSRVQVEEPSGPVVSKLVINGIVRRKGGRTTVWVNGDEVDRGQLTREGVAVDTERATADIVRLRLPSGRQSIALRAGQQIDMQTGLVREPYERSAQEDARSAFEQSEDTQSPQAGEGSTALDGFTSPFAPEGQNIQPPPSPQPPPAVK